MKKCVCTVLIGLTLACGVVADDMTGPEIIRKVSDLINQQTCKATMNLTVITTSGKERRFTYDSYTADKGEKSVIVYTDPVRVRGQANLMLNNADDIWAYYPRTDRVRKMATHAKKQKMQGSDFTYEDMGSGETWLTDFTTVRLDDDKTQGEACFTVRLIRTDESTSSYTSIVMWVAKSNFVPLVIDYYHEDDPELCKKRLTQGDIQLIDEIPTPMTMVMHNNLDNTETTIKITVCEYNVEIEKNRFTERGFYR